MTVHCAKSCCLSSSTVKLLFPCIFILWLTILNSGTFWDKVNESGICCVVSSDQFEVSLIRNKMLHRSSVLIIINSNFSPLINDCGAPSTYRLGTRSSFLRGKMEGHRADHSPPSSAEVRNGYSSASTLLYVFIG